MCVLHIYSHWFISFNLLNAKSVKEYYSKFVLETHASQRNYIKVTQVCRKLIFILL